MTFCLDRAGLVGDDGATHHGVFDIAYLRPLPNMVLCSPKNTDELRDMMRFAALYKSGPLAVRYPRGGDDKTDFASGANAPIELGKSEVLRSGDNLSIIAYGPLVNTALQAALQMEAEHGVSAQVINARWAKPLDADVILDAARRTGKIITLEDGVLRGGFGSAILELLAENGLTDVEVKMLGIPDHFVEHGPIPILRGLCGMDVLGVLQASESLLHRPLAPTTPGEAAGCGGKAVGLSPTGLSPRPDGERGLPTMPTSPILPA